ncbi:hypothetical protein C2845_PM14G14950 [Panicum miliaceum]|uniref:Uncharacterized protein n=1 Tax=Panicum miliaceum TaxID=4540 RepID=A0A3L6PRZ4_PANMI|nr:hypothetical protein C2845_PM14G14950 [Panicum miliaceum]
MIGEQDLPGMDEYLMRAVIRETMRLRTPAPLLLLHKSKQQAMHPDQRPGMRGPSAGTRRPGSRWRRSGLRVSSAAKASFHQYPFEKCAASLRLSSINHLP